MKENGEKGREQGEEVDSRKARFEAIDEWMFRKTGMYEKRN